jgi:hypothetical protein
MTTFNGLICSKHPDENGKRYIANNTCVACNREQVKRWADANKDKTSAAFSNWRKKNKKHESARAKSYYADNKEQLLTAAKDRYWSEPDTYRRKAKEQRDKDGYRERVNAWRREKRKQNTMFLLSEHLRTRIAKAFTAKSWRKGAGTITLVGCSCADAKKHIESLFQPGMNWGNRQLWHIDHIKPLSKAATPDELRALCHYTNLQPLWAEDNWKKHTN